VGRRTVLAAAITASAVTAIAAGGTAVAGAATRAGYSDAIEAEDMIHTIDIQQVACAACSGGARITGLGGAHNGDASTYFSIPENGYYTVTVYYSSDRPRDLSINDKRLRGLDSGAADTVAKRSIRLYLKTRFRVAEVSVGYHTGTPGADVDRIEITRA
jgi:hypothetical protein